MSECAACPSVRHVNWLKPPIVSVRTLTRYAAMWTSDCTSPWLDLDPQPLARILETAGADRNVFGSGSSAGKEFANPRIVARLSSPWYHADSLLPARAHSSAAVA